MFDWLWKLLAWIGTLWKGLPEPAKEAIIKAIVDAFEGVFRSLFKANKGGEEKASA